MNDDERNATDDGRSPSEPADVDLLARARAGDRAAHAEIYARFSTDVMTVARRMLGSTSRAEDALQDTFVEVLRGIDGFRDEAAIRTWIRRIAINKCLSQIRSRWWSRRADDDVESVAAAAGAGSPEIEVDLARMLDRLPDTARAVVWLHDAEGYTHKEIAGLLGRTESFSKSQLQRAHRRLRASIANDSPEEPAPVCTPELKTI